MSDEKKKDETSVEDIPADIMDDDGEDEAIIEVPITSDDFSTTRPNGEIKCIDPNFPEQIWNGWGSGRRETYNKIYLSTKRGKA